MRYHHLDLALDEIKKAGAKVDIEISKRSSIKLWISFNNQRRLVVASKTPRSHRVDEVVRMHVRQAINAMK